MSVTFTKKKKGWNCNGNWVTILQITAPLSVCVSMAAPYQHLSDRLLRWGWRGRGQRSALWFIISPRGTRGLPAAAAQQWRGGDRLRHLWREETGNKRSVLTSPLSLRGDNHSEKLTGCPEARGRESEAEERRKRRKVRGESGIIASLSRRKKQIYHEIKMKKKKKELSLSVHPSASQTPLRRVVNKCHNSVRTHNRPVNQDQRPI